MEFGKGRIANQAGAASCVGRSGNTVVVATASPGPELMVQYRQSYHAVGQIPDAKSRRDNTRILSPAEILASRAIDRAIRPIFASSSSTTTTSNTTATTNNNENSSNKERSPVDIQVKLQSYDPLRGGHPVAVAINTAAACCHVPVAATVLAVHASGTVVQDPSVTVACLDDSDVDVIGTLLYAGTDNDQMVMMEWTSHQAPLPDNQWKNLLEIAQASIQPILSTVREYQQLDSKLEEDSNPPQETNQLDAALRASLGLPPRPLQSLAEVVPPIRTIWDDKAFLNDCVVYCREAIGESIDRIFGFQPTNCVLRSMEATDLTKVQMHSLDDDILLSKQYRAQRETIVRSEVARLMQECAGNRYGGLTETDSMPEMERALEQICYQLFEQSMWSVSSQYGERADHRRGSGPGSGWNTIRPVRIQVPALPDNVHGSALFARGDTQVLCTATLAPPKDGLAQDPWLAKVKQKLKAGDIDDKINPDTESLPVGSLRYLRSQEALLSDLNSSKVKADREQTGDSGRLNEVKRLWMQYDFPSYVTKSGAQRERRAVGHGALAERALECVLPTEFPYVVRLTSEVTDSNGSSSMASVCGATLALLDAGVKLKEPVAGVSVGLAIPYEKGLDMKPSLLLDITGTEDHYGGMDMKVAGTLSGVTAIQLDVKRPANVSTILDGLQLASAGRRKILDEMNVQMASVEIFRGLNPRPAYKDSAPRVEVIAFDPKRKKDLIGPGGAVLRQLENRYGVSLDLTQDGRCLLFGDDRILVAQAKAAIMDLVADVVEGQVYTGTVIELKDFGAIIELLRNKEGILHVSELTPGVDALFLKKHSQGAPGYLREVLHVGQQIEVMCIGVDHLQGTIRLSRKAVLEQMDNSNKPWYAQI